jgi:hypothetical protein
LREPRDDQREFHLRQCEADAVAGARPSGTQAISASSRRSSSKPTKRSGSKRKGSGQAAALRPARCGDQRINVPFGMPTLPSSPPCVRARRLAHDVRRVHEARGRSRQHGHPVGKTTRQLRTRRFRTAPHRRRSRSARCAFGPPHNAGRRARGRVAEVPVWGTRQQRSAASSRLSGTAGWRLLATRPDDPRPALDAPRMTWRSRCSVPPIGPGIRPDSSPPTPPAGAMRRPPRLTG